MFRRILAVLAVGALLLTKAIVALFTLGHGQARYGLIAAPRAPGRPG